MTEHHPDIDELAIEREIRSAVDEGREINHTTARDIAMRLQGGNQESALYELATTGAIPDHGRLTDELVARYNAPEATPQVKRWVDLIGTYAAIRTNSRQGDAIEGWLEQPSPPAPDFDENLERLPSPKPSQPPAEGRKGI